MNKDQPWKLYLLAVGLAVLAAVQFGLFSQPAVHAILYSQFLQLLDQQKVSDRPDRKGRLAILKVHLHKIIYKNDLDCVYFSFTTYTTIGFGDIAPTGHLKYLTGLQALTGLVLITWTVSFLFLEMQKYWKAK